MLTAITGGVAALLVAIIGFIAQYRGQHRQRELMKADLEILALLKKEDLHHDPLVEIIGRRLAWWKAKEIGNFGFIVGVVFYMFLPLTLFGLVLSGIILIRDAPGADINMALDDALENAATLAFLLAAQALILIVFLGWRESRVEKKVERRSAEQHESTEPNRIGQDGTP